MMKENMEALDRVGWNKKIKVKSITSEPRRLRPLLTHPLCFSHLFFAPENADYLYLYCICLTT